MVSDGARLAQWERREVRQPTEPRSVPQLMRALNTDPQEQPPLRAAAGVGFRRRGSRRAVVVAATVGAGGARSRPQRRRFHSASERHPRRMEPSDRVCGCRRADADNQHRIIHRMRSIRNYFLVFAVVAAWTAALAASKPVFWQTATLNDFLRGEVENLSVDGHGRLVLGPATELVAETTAPFLWAMAVAPDGAIYVGAATKAKSSRSTGRQNHDVLRRGGARSARARARHRRHAVRCHIAGRAHLQDRP